MKIRKEKYFFNPASLRYESVRKSIRKTVIRVASFLILSFIVAAIYYSVYSVFFDTYSEYSINRENKILEENLLVLNEKFEQLNDVLTDISKRDTNIYSAIFESKPMDMSTVSSNQRFNRHEDFYKMSNTELILLTENRLSTITKKTSNQSFLMDSLKAIVNAKQGELEYIPAIIPLTNFHFNSVGASIGEKIHPIYKSLHTHSGMDFAMPVGSEVIVTASGTVKDIISKPHSSGTEIRIDHGNNYETRYQYLGNANVKKGQKVTRGDILGLVGNIGITVPHLHYEVRKDGKIADPLNYFFMNLSPKESQLIAAISLDKGQSLD